MDSIPLRSQSFAPSESNQSLNFSGSDLKTEDIVAKSDDIFIGKITGIVQGASAKEQGVTTYIVSIELTECLLGNVANQLTASVKTFVGYHQIPPQYGTSYIFFVRTKGGNFAAFKLLPATDDNIAKVKALIAAASK